MNMLLLARDIADSWLVRRIEFIYRTSSILDVGSGRGYISTRLGARMADLQKYDAHNLWQFRDKQFDLILCCNVLEHLHSPEIALKEMARVGRRMYLCWTPWCSPYGGHEFSPLHFIGRTTGKVHQLNVNLYKTSVDQVLKWVVSAGWTITDKRPRYWPWFPWLLKLPWKLKDFMSWNVEIHCTAIDKK